MNTMSPPIPSIQQLLKSTLIALVAAIVLLVVVVLPSEYGIDPLGTGKLLGLSALGGDAEELVDVVPSSSAGVISTDEPVSIFAAELKNDVKTITLDAFDGMEMKATMNEGDHFVFSWNANGDMVFTDMHGEKFDAGDEFSTYWKEKEQTEGAGVFTAPFAGTHGWYWQNMGDEPVTITLEVSGFYQSLAEKH